VGEGVWRTQLRVDGLHCAGCVWLIEQMPGALEGVRDARLDLGRGRLAVEWDARVEEPGAILEWLAKFGYEAAPLSAAKVAGSSSAERDELRRVGVAWALAGNVMLLSSAHYSGLDAVNDGALAVGSSWLMLILATISVVYCARVVATRAWASARAWVRAHMAGRSSAPLSVDVPLALGITIGWAASAWATVTGQGEVWLDSVAMLTAAILTARWLQRRASASARSAAERSLALLPQVARRINGDGEVEEVEAGSLEAGALVEVRSGELIPVDGRIERGEAAIHRGVLDGESRPRSAGPGDEVAAGTTNLSGVLFVRATASGARTRVGQLMTWIDERGARRAPAVQRADRLGGWFVAGVLLAAGLAAAWWWGDSPAQAARVAVAILVVSCPCALGMATPLALAVACGRAARRGIFIKHDDVLEALAGADVVVLDKTGTLTRGVPRVASQALAPEVADAGTLELAGALEASSNHPLARAIAQLAGATRREVEVLEDRAGHGVRGLVDGREVCVGRPEWVAHDLRALPEELAGALARAERAGQTAALVSVDGVPAALVALEDELRPEAARVVGGLRAQGARPVILSGDRQGAVDEVARALGIPAEDALGMVSPEDKLAHIERLQAGGASVVMVGDGVNDALAMQRADAAIAVAGGAQVSLVAADAFLTEPGLGGVEELARGARQVGRVVGRHIAWALGYNAVCVALAAAGWIDPLAAAVLMPLSSAALALSSVAQRTFTAPAPIQEGAPVRRAHGALAEVVR
jgi:Cu2+-exporting ATPase